MLLLLDAEIYHLLLNSSFLANLAMEMSGVSKEKIHTNMMRALFPESYIESRKEYEESTAKLPFELKKTFFRVFTGEREGGLGPVFYDGLFYCCICLCLWIVAGISISSYIYFQGYEFVAIVCGILTPLVSCAVCVHLVRKTLGSGIKKFKLGNKNDNKK